MAEKGSNTVNLLNEGVQRLSVGDSTGARSVFQNVLQQEPGNADALNLLGVVEAQEGNLPKSLDLIQQAIQKRDNVPDYWLNFSLVQAQAGMGDAALQSLQKAKSLAPGDGRIIQYELQVLQHTGRFEEAVGIYETLLKSQPDNVQLLVGLAVAALQAGQGQKAFEMAQKAREIKPKSKSVLQTLGAAAMGVGQWQLAIQCFQAVSMAEPDNPLIYEEWSRAEYELGNYKRAIRQYQKFMELTPDKTPDHYFTLGRLYFTSRQPEKAARNFDKALSAWLENSEILSLRANCYIHENRLKEAKEFFEKALELDPENIDAHYQYRNLIKTEKGDPIFNFLEGFKEKNLVDAARINLCFLLGKLYHGIKDYDRAFENYRLANDVIAKKYKDEGTVYDKNNAVGEMEEIKRIYTKKVLKDLAGQGSDDERPVFIVGMPRSGTTLMEQIISSHPKAEGRGEVDVIHYLHHECLDAVRDNPEKSLEEILKEKRADWVKRFQEVLETKDRDVRRITDKMPANFRSLGLIALLFPRAKIIHIRRDPRDTAVSIFSNAFDKGHPYSTSLEDIGHYYRLYEDLMTYWQKVLPIPILEVSYEELVADQKKKTQEILEFVGLEWDDNCLDFHKHDRAAMTLSSIQVRKPMNRSSVSKWKRYEKHLKPLLNALKENPETS